jgi:hypothetical protein
VTQRTTERTPAGNPGGDSPKINDKQALNECFYFYCPADILQARVYLNLGKINDQTQGLVIYLGGQGGTRHFCPHLS